MIKRILLAGILSCLAFLLSAQQSDYCPKADPAAIVIAGNARFTVLTPQLIRMEWSQDGVFEDNATLTFVNRLLPVPEFKVSQTKSKVVK
jgi:alpha-glucosidase